MWIPVPGLLRVLGLLGPLSDDEQAKVADQVIGAVVFYRARRWWESVDNSEDSDPEHLYHFASSLRWALGPEEYPGYAQHENFEVDLKLCAIAIEMQRHAIRFGSFGKEPEPEVTPIGVAIAGVRRYLTAVDFLDDLLGGIGNLESEDPSDRVRGAGLSASSELFDAIFTIAAMAHKASPGLLAESGYSAQGRLAQFVRAFLPLADRDLAERVTGGEIEREFTRWNSRAILDQTRERAMKKPAAIRSRGAGTRLTPIGRARPSVRGSRNRRSRARKA
jgi:hypothetical protein